MQWLWIWQFRPPPFTYVEIVSRGGGVLVKFFSKKTKKFFLAKICPKVTEIQSLVCVRCQILCSFYGYYVRKLNQTVPCASLNWKILIYICHNFMFILHHFTYLHRFDIQEPASKENSTFSKKFCHIFLRTKINW